MSEREIRKFLMVGTLTGMITTVKNLIVLIVVSIWGTYQFSSYRLPKTTSKIMY
jgi:hypothetical protein